VGIVAVIDFFIKREYNIAMKSIIQFFVSQEDGVYTAEGVNAPIVTEGKTFEELKDNIIDAVKLFFKDETPASLGFSRSPSILTNFELSLNLHGSRA
jgi:predicted RNase H-like HicB family nuclease